MITSHDFVSKANEIHQNNYQYIIHKQNLVTRDKITITCPNHGDFQQSCVAHLRGSRCPKCARLSGIKNRTKSLEKFIEEATEIHGTKYSYEYADYINAHTKIKIECPVHGIFGQAPHTHIKGKAGCWDCAVAAKGFKQRKGTDKFIQQSSEIHQNFYDYSKVQYTRNYDKVEIICPIHGEFHQNAYEHMTGSKCPKCMGFSKSVDELIIKFNKVHREKYDYSLVDSTKIKSKNKIICKKHGIFKISNDDHLGGHGCAICGQRANLLELKLFETLEKKYPNLNIIYQYRPDWLSPKSLDIYIPQLKLGIEYQGIQHFKPVYFFGGDVAYDETLKRDEDKRILCTENNCKLIYFSYKTSYIPEDFKYPIISEEERLFAMIDSIL